LAVDRLSGNGGETGGQRPQCPTEWVYTGSEPSIDGSDPVYTDMAVFLGLEYEELGGHKHEYSLLRRSSRREKLTVRKQFVLATCSLLRLFEPAADRTKPQL